MLVQVRLSVTVGDPGGHTGHPQPALQCARVAAGPGAAGPPDAFSALTDALFQPVGGKRLVKQRMRLAFLVGIPDPDLQRVQSHLLTNLIQLRFHRERGLRRTVAAIAAADHIIRVYRHPFPAPVRAIIGVHESEQSMHHDYGGAVSGIRAGVKGALAAACNNGPVPFHSGLEFHPYRVPRSGNKLFGPAVFEPDRFSGLQTHQRSQWFDITEVQLAAESATHVRRLDYANFTFRDIQHKREFLAQAEQMLIGTVHRQVAGGIGIHQNQARLHITGMHPLGLVAVFKDTVRLGQRGIHVARFNKRMLGNIVLRVIMQRRGAVGHGLAGVEQRRQLLVFYVDQFQGLCGNVD